MTTKTVDRREFEKSVGPLLDFVAAGNEVLIVDHDQVRARLVTTEPRKLGLNKGKVWMADEFDAPLPDSFWTGEEK